MRPIAITIGVIIIATVLLWILRFSPFDNVPQLDIDDLRDNPEDYGHWFLDKDWDLLRQEDFGFDERFTWINQNGMAILSYLTFESSLVRAIYLDDIFLDDLFQHFESFTIEANCQSSGVRLYEITANYENTTYIINHYTWNIGETHSWGATYLFPAYEEDILQTYMEVFQPDLTSCEE